ncbi:MAG: Protein DipZ [Stenotrophomonas maltophilia]|uniref:Protein DipZ n=1 Tax=Stenotrophomonas maltophilia TaxID=40324 RepID=A0A7V8FF17_STEMA|nr:MAG: Protein DipZ [Stenotrophomonas maltophilia]
MIDFWTYSCINCLRAMPFVHEWERRYRDHGLVVIGVHTPEFAFERDPRNVMKAAAQLKVQYPVALDNQYAIWRAFNNHYWPAQYFVDANGQVRAHQFGEGNYAQSEQVIRRLLTEAGQRDLPPPADPADEALQGVAVQADMGNLQSPATYLGHARAEQFASPGGQRADAPFDYTLPGTLTLNQWGLQGRWTVDDESAQLQQAGGRIGFQFHARDLHLVLAPKADGNPVRFRVWLDGKPLPASDAGSDVGADGTGCVDEHRLYQLVR